MSVYEETICDANILYKAYRAAIKNSSWKDSVQKFMLHYLRGIFSLQDDLRNRTLTNSPSREFVHSERGTDRFITSIPLRDRMVRHVLCDDIFMPEIKKHIIYDNCASVKGRGLSMQRKRFEVHLHKYYKMYGTNEGWIVFGDFTKFYDNIIHSIAKQRLLELVDNDEYVSWLLDLIFDSFKMDVSYMSSEEYSNCMESTFNRNEYLKIDKSLLTGEKWMEKSVNIGDQLSQIIGIYYPHPIDNYVKYVRGVKCYGRYMDDFYFMCRSKEEAQDILKHVYVIAKNLGIHMNDEKTHICKLSGTYQFLKVKYSLSRNGKIIKRICPKTVTRMRRKLKKLAAKVQSGERDYAYIEDMFRSWMGSFYKLMTREQRNNMVALYEELFNKKITVTHRKLIIIDNLISGGDDNVEKHKAV